MTNLDDINKLLSEWEELCEKANPGPWEPYVCQFAEKADDGQFGCGIDGESYDWSRDECHHPVPIHDLKLMAASRTLVPRLIKAVRAAESRWGQLDKHHKLVAGNLHAASVTTKIIHNARQDMLKALRGEDEG